MNQVNSTCELCSSPGGALLINTPDWRIIRVTDPVYPGFCRVVWNRHVAEMTDLGYRDQLVLMSVVLVVEETIRDLFNPDKINLASLGNVVPHLHWHIIPRWLDDKHFPEPIWGNVHNPEPICRPVVTDEILLEALLNRLRTSQIDIGEE